MKYIVVLVLFFSSVLTLKAQTDKQLGFVTEVGQQVPDFEVKMTDGKVVKMSELKGKLVLVNFWGPQCCHCLVEMRRFQKDIIDRFKGKVVIVPIDSKKSDLATVKQVGEKQGFKFPLAYDESGKVAELFFMPKHGIPRTFLIDPKGKIIYQAYGYNPKKFEELLELIAKMLDAKK